MKQHFIYKILEKLSLTRLWAAEGQFWWRAALVFFFNQKCHKFTASSFSNVHICLFCSSSVSVFVFWIVGWMKQAVGICLLLGKGTIFWHLINKQLIYKEDKTGRFMDTVKKVFSQAFFASFYVQLTSSTRLLLPCLVATIPLNPVPAAKLCCWETTTGTIILCLLVFNVALFDTCFL